MTILRRMGCSLRRPVARPASDRWASCGGRRWRPRAFCSTVDDGARPSPLVAPHDEPKYEKNCGKLKLVAKTAYLRRHPLANLCLTECSARLCDLGDVISQVFAKPSDHG